MRVRTSLGRDAVAAGVLAAVFGGGQLFVYWLVNSRQPVPTVVASHRLVIVFLLTVGGCATIAIRRRWPIPALAGATALVLACTALALASMGPAIGLVVCAYTVGTRYPGRVTGPVLAGLAAVHAAGGILLTRAGGAVQGLPTFWGVPGQDLGAMILATTASFAIPGTAGLLIGRRRAHVAKLTARAEQLEAERAERDRRAAAEERRRIARELHDIAAHDLSAIVVQAGAADRLVDADPAGAKAVLRDIRGQGRDTLTALRQLVGIMREDDGAGRAPQPGLDRAGDLLAVARAAGMTVAVEVRGAPQPRSAQVDLAAYRVLQEALTNARRHASGAPVTVHIVHDQGVRIRVANASTREASATGNGLAGMRERVRQAGGTVSAGPGRGVHSGQWVVDVWLPA